MGWMLILGVVLLAMVLVVDWMRMRKEEKRTKQIRKIQEEVIKCAPMEEVEKLERKVEEKLQELKRYVEVAGSSNGVLSAKGEEAAKPGARDPMSETAYLDIVMAKSDELEKLIKKGIKQK